MNLLTKEGFSFAFDPSACFSCEGNCCRGESGYIWLKGADIKAISAFLEIGLDDFKNNYVKKYYNGYSLKEIKVNEEYQCVFFDEKNKRCEIYPVRPTQCRTFPFWKHFKNNIEEVERECPGIIKN